jgi:UDP:flavonoid glycosyltransferase YjiC (YdhE family)
MLAIHRALRARAADVVVATHGGVHERLLAEAGVSYQVVGPRMSDARCAQFVRMGAGMGPPNQSMWSDAEIETYVQAEAAFFRAHGVRAAVTGFTLTTLLSTRLANVKLITEHAGSFVPPVWERNMVEPFLDSPFPLGNRMPRATQRWLANLGIHHVKRYCAGFNRVARRLGIEGVPSFATLLLGDLTLVPDAPEVLGISRAELEDWRPGPKGYRAGMRMRYSGPLFAELDRALPERVRQFLEGPRPIVYLAPTSTTTEQLRAIVGAMRGSGMRLLVASTVHALADLESDDVLIEGVLPSQLVMPQVDLAITAGGQGSVQCALASGTPLVAIPLQPEQDFNGQLLERHGAGRRISLRDAGTPKLVQLAQAILAEPSFRENARRIAAIYAGLDGAKLAADAILEFARIAPTADTQPRAARA